MRKSGSLFPYSAGGEFGSLGGRSFCKILESGEAETSQSHAGGVCVWGGFRDRGVDLGDLPPGPGGCDLKD